MRTWLVACGPYFFLVQRHSGGAGVDGARRLEADGVVWPSGRDTPPTRRGSRGRR